MPSLTSSPRRPGLALRSVWPLRRVLTDALRTPDFLAACTCPRPDCGDPDPPREGGSGRGLRRRLGRSSGASPPPPSGIGAFVKGPRELNPTAVTRCSQTRSRQSSEPRMLAVPPSVTRRSSSRSQQRRRQCRGRGRSLWHPEARGLQHSAHPNRKYFPEPRHCHHFLSPPLAVTNAENYNRGPRESVGGI